MVRRERVQLLETIERSRQIYGPLEARYNDQDKMWRLARDFVELKSMSNRVIPERRALRSRAQRPDWLAGVRGLELRNVVANYPFESSRGFPGSEPNSGHG